MAERINSPAVANIGSSGAPVPEAPDAGAVPDRPLWMKESARSRKRRRAKKASRARHRVVVDSPDAEAALSWKARLTEWFRTASAAGFGLSLLVHLLLLLAMALWIIPQITTSQGITTVVESDSEEPQPFDSMDDVHLDSPAGSKDVVIPQVTNIASQDAEMNVLEHQFLQDVTAADTQGEGGTGDFGKGGFRLLEPKNAVKAGSFTAWTIPIADRDRFPGAPQAGDSPRPGQDYHIVIQVKIPGGRTTYSIADLSGKVVGTDGYVQIIPAQAFVQDEDGRLVLARLGRKLPVEEGVVQILIRVPGAHALVKDTIRIKSKLLKEEQTLELIFGKQRSRG